jgi:cytoskeleton protein RodZ
VTPEKGQRMDELDEPEVETVGERLRATRTEKGLSLEDIAAQTRIPQRHLESLEAGEWDKLPASTYTIGFARSYATMIGLDQAEISRQLRSEMGRARSTSAAAEVFEPVDPARTMPKWLVFGAIAAVILLVVVMSWLSRRSLDQPAAPAADSIAPPVASSAPTPPATLAPQPAASAQGPVVLTANEPVWLRINDGRATLREGVLDAGQSYEVPANAKAPVLTTGKPEALRIAVGTATAPPVGPPATTVHASLLGPDLMHGPTAAAPAAAPPAQ